MHRYIRPPVLRDWLASIGAKNTFQLTQAGRLVELWSANGRVFLVVVNANGGWEIFTACDSITSRHPPPRQPQEGHLSHGPHRTKSPR